MKILLRLIFRFVSVKERKQLPSHIYLQWISLLGIYIQAAGPVAGVTIDPSGVAVVRFADRRAAEKVFARSWTVTIRQILSISP